ncbi:MAG TPA: glyoxalase superfamily protein [Candidatus Acidoferrum sp.]|nr:glyoxalase superfamily protein [Candidatus Acidoferrum sp.]
MRQMVIGVACLAFSSFGALACGRERARSPLEEAARACSHDSELSCPRPIFNVRSLRESQRYYRDQLGFKIDWEYGEPPDFGSVSRAQSVIFMCQGCQGTPGAWTMLFAQDVDRLYEEFRRRKAIIKMPPTDRPWGLREMHVADPDGNILRFGSGIDD